jgi:TldD protein
MGELSGAEESLYRLVARLAQRAPFVEVLAEAATGLSVRYDSHGTSFQSQPRMRGAVFRSWTRTGWSEVAVSGLDAASLRLAEGTIERVLAHRPPREGPPGISSTARLETFTASSRPIQDMGEEEIGKLARDVFAWTTGIPDIRNTHVSIGWRQDERLYLNSAGARCLQGVCRVRGSVRPIALENGRAKSETFLRGGVGGREILDALTPENARKAAEEARELLHAKEPPSGPRTVLLSPSLTGYFAHESFGHGAEADQFVRDRSYLKPLLGKMVAPELLTIVDNGGYPGAWSQIYCDDEGHPAQRTVLVEKGRFVGALHDRDSAAAVGALPTGNTRRSDILSRSFVRMTNTYVEPGESSLEELLEEVRDGVLLESGTSGIEDPLGGLIQVKARKGHLIEHGKVTRLLSSMALSGNVLEFLASIRGLSGKEDFALDTSSCGKGMTDFLPNSAGGPYLLSTAVVGPA